MGFYSTNCCSFAIIFIMLEILEYFPLFVALHSPNKLLFQLGSVKISTKSDDWMNGRSEGLTGGTESLTNELHASSFSLYNYFDAPTGAH